MIRHHIDYLQGIDSAEIIDIPCRRTRMSQRSTVSSSMRTEALGMLAYTRLDARPEVEPVTHIR